MVAMGQLQHGHLGNECSGIVVAVGDEVADFEVGDWVCTVSEGAFANCSRVRGTSAWNAGTNESQSGRIHPDCILHSLLLLLFEVGRLQPGEQILIHAAAVILAKRLMQKYFQRLIVLVKRTS
ncbi:fatty acid synthase [Histoplasma capsulatum var. duboisii H88]|uniref:Fatty acid synthase n=1 Tax=Ajellomyces capsulatus (strain H88) TaxID=544711 RepID=A0A8A1LCS7_AJEC8|nr:fatty acid synthase [Histoplasma capsulatum var. duboisii H88]